MRRRGIYADSFGRASGERYMKEERRYWTRNFFVPADFPSTNTSAVYSPGGNPIALSRRNSVAAESLYAYRTCFLGSSIRWPPYVHLTLTVPVPLPAVVTDRNTVSCGPKVNAGTAMVLSPFSDRPI